MVDPNAKRLFWFLFAGTRGGPNRIRIIEVLRSNPLNLNQIAEILKLDYKSVLHHILVLEKNNLVNKIGEKYGAVYFISNYLESNIETYDIVISQIKKNRDNNNAL